MAENMTNKDRLKDITYSIETGIKELFPDFDKRDE